MTTGWADPGDTGAGLESGYLEKVADDIASILGAGIEIDALEIADIGSDERAPDPASGQRRTGLRARYHFGDRALETTAPGETLIDAHRQLRARLVIDRLRLTFTDTVEPERRR